MSIPETVFDPPFNITRASHVVLTVSDLARSKTFYEDVMGLVTTEQDGDALYMRGIEEVCHHSFTLKQRKGDRQCEQVGYRVSTDDELEKAHRYFSELGLKPGWAEVPGQGKTLRVVDSVNVPLEFCAQMTRVPHKAFNYNEHRGGTAMRFDHFQLQVPDVDAAWRNYAAMGFRTSEYIRTPDGRAFAIFLHRKDASWDFVIVANTGPRLHHVGFITASLTKIFDAGDVAGRSGLGRIAEYGPGTHPGGHGRFVYFRDPDGHRVELVLAPPHHRMDMDSHVPVDFSTVPGAEWHFPAQEKWWAEATEFSATKAKAPDEPFSYRTLEGFLSQQKAAAR